ncbi:MAG TPA: FAD-dependent oxidoreductase [Cellulomonas sp.]
MPAHVPASEPAASTAAPGPAAPGPARPAPAGPVPGLRHVLVVGAGLAGARTVVELRAQGFEGRITVLGAEGVPPYDRPPLSKHLFDRPSPAWLADELDVDALALADDVRLGEPATGLRVDPDEVGVRTATGEVVADAVVLATGSAPVRPAAWRAARTLHGIEDAQALRDALATAADGGQPRVDQPGPQPDGPLPRRLVVIGAGWIGAEVATVAAAAGTHVTVVEAHETPLGGVLGPRVGGLTAPWYAAAGVRLLTGVPVAEVAADAVTLADGTVLPADVALAAIGARPATGWLTQTGAGTVVPFAPDGSVPVDEGYAPLGGSPRVRAVGDVARRRSARHGWAPGGHWDGALRGPAVAVGALLGTADPTATDLTPYVFSTQLGHELALHGVPGPTDEVLLRGDPAGPDGWSALWFVAGTDRLTAVLAVDRPRDVSGARRLLGRATLPELDRTRAADPAVPLPRTER